MKDRNKLSLRGGVTICAEVAAILSLLLNYLMYQQNRTNSGNNFQALNSLIAISFVVNIALLMFFAATVLYFLYSYYKGKKHTLQNKFNAYISSDPQYLRFKTSADKQALISKTTAAIKKIDESKAFDQNVYYMILYALFFTSERSINVVSILDDNEWVDTPEEDEFLRVNLAVTERKIHLNRIFVISKEDAKDKLSNNSIRSFIESDRTYIHLFVVFKEALTRSLINDIGSGYIDFDSYAVACDVFSDKEIRGTLKFDKREIDRYYNNFMRLSEHYLPLNQNFIDTYLK